MNKGSIVQRLCSDLIAKNRDINGLLYFTLGMEHEGVRKTVKYNTQIVNQPTSHIHDRL